MLRKQFSILVLFLSVVAVALFSVYTSCKKNTDCTAIISVIDGNTNMPIPSCSVAVHPTQGTNTLTIQGQVGITDGSGSASFTFKLPAILSIDVGAPPPPTTYTVSSCTQCGLVKLEIGKTVNKTIKMY